MRTVRTWPTGQQILEAFQACDELLHRDQRWPAGQAHKAHFQGHLRHGRLTDFFDELRQPAKQTLELSAFVGISQLLGARELIGRERDRGIGTSAHHTQHHEIARAFQELPREMKQIEPLLRDRRHTLQACSRIS